MKIDNSISELFDGGLEEIFNPAVAYQGNYAFSTDVFSMVSKVEKGKNKVEEYLEKKYYVQIRNILAKMNFTANPRLFVLSDLAGNYGRNLKMCIELFIIEFSHILTGQVFESSGNDETLKDEAVQYFRDYRKKLSEIQIGNINVDNERINEFLKEDYLLNEEHRKRVMGKKYRIMSYADYLSLKKDYITSFIVGLRYLFPLFDKPINLNELGECLDFDKFCLAMAKQMIDVSRSTLQTENAIHNSFVYVEKYMIAVKSLRAKGAYDLKVDTISLDGKHIRYSVDDAIREYNEIKTEHPEFSVYHFETDGRDYRNIELVNDFTVEIESYIESKKLQASWEFIRKGISEKKNTDTINDDLVEVIKNRIGTKKKTREEKRQLMIDRMSFLDNTEYLYKMTGKNNFTGYVGYIYANGTVVFEKYYKNFETREPVETAATYVMNFNNFVEMSMLTKTEIMSYIKQGGTDVRRVYHTGTWCDRILNVICDKTYDEKKMKRIDQLINEGQLSKKKK